MNELRPTRFSDILGQDDVISRLTILVDAAKIRNDVLPHILLDGPPGLGKTTISCAIANELERPILIANGATIRTVKSILPYIMRAEQGSIVFIDEIHRLPKIVEEFLYPVLEDSRADLSSKSGDKYESVTINLPKFTVIGATTISGNLSRPLHDRFGIQQHLELYSDENLALLIKQNCVKLNLNISDKALLRIASSSRGTPRVANNRLLWIRDYILTENISVITDEVAQAALKKLGITEEGLDENDIKYLTALVDIYKGGPVGLEVLANTISISAETIVNTIEPFLIRKGLIERTQKGRRVL